METCTKVEIERYVEQVQDGEFYKGHVKIGEVVLDYQLVFPVPIARLDKIVLTPESGSVRDFFRIVLLREGKVVELSDEEYDFFFFLLNEFAVDFYHAPQTRAYNEAILQRREDVRSADYTAPLSVVKKDTLHLPDKILKMLSNLK